MNIQDLLDLAKDIEALQKENKNLKFLCDLQHKQLVLIAVHHNGRLKNIHYENLDEIDWTKTHVGIGMDSVSVSNEIGQLIKSYDKLPKL